MSSQAEWIAKPSFRWPVSVREVCCYLVVCIVLATYFITLYPIRYANYVPVGDEPAFLAGSIKADPYQWFTSGYSRYFVVYPEWFKPYTDFIRPMTNAYVWSLHTIFSDNFAYYLYTYYLAVLIATLLLFRCLNDIGAKGALVSFAAVIWPLSPAVVSAGLSIIPFMFDVVAALIVLLAFRAVIYERYFLAALTLTLAVATKETAVFAPLAASLTILLTRRFSLRNLAISALMLLPLVLWAAARQLCFGQILGGNYTPTGIDSLLRGIDVWPVGINTITSLKAILSARKVTNIEQIFHIAAFIVDCLLWITILLIYVLRFIPLALPALGGEAKPIAQSDSRLLAAMIWFCGAISYLVLNGLGGRYGGCYYLFLLIVLISVAERDTQKWMARLSLSSLVAMALLYIPATYYELKSLRADAETATKLGASLQRSLSQLGGPGREILIVNAPPGYSAPKWIGRLLDSPHELVFVNQFEGCASAPGFSGLPVKAKQGLRIELPECASLIFDGAINSQFTSGTIDIVDRPGVGVYSFGDGKLSSNKLGYFFVGRQFYFHSDPSVADLIYYNWNDKAYEHLVW